MELRFKPQMTLPYFLVKATYRTNGATFFSSPSRPLGMSGANDTGGCFFLRGLHLMPDFLLVFHTACASSPLCPVGLGFLSHGIEQGWVRFGICLRWWVFGLPLG